MKTVETHFDLVSEDDLVLLRDQILFCENYRLQSSGSNPKSVFFMGYLDPHAEQLLWKYISELTRFKSYEKCYINAHPANQPGQWHTDCSEAKHTALWFPKMDDLWEPLVYNSKDQGALELTDVIVPYVENCLVLFEGNIPHRALNHEQIGKMRFSIAFKALEK